MPAKTLLLLLTLCTAWADEGFWTFNNFPAKEVEKRYDFLPSAPWLEHVRLSSLRILPGCSASFVSPLGLVLTNHHCVRTCISQITTPEHNYLQNGFYAAEASGEKQCPAMQIDRLEQISDVSARVLKAGAGQTGEAFAKAVNAEKSRIERECLAPGVNCEVVTLYGGARYELYRYRRWNDVRLAFAPEVRAAHFGGDPDNFNFPRVSLDFALLRVYEDGKPATPQHFMRISQEGVKAGELVFTSGHPGASQRLKTITELEFLRDVELPFLISQLSEERGMLAQFQTRGPEQARIATSPLMSIENSLKALRGEHAALGTPSFFRAKIAADEELRKRAAQLPGGAQYASAWSDIARAVDRHRAVFVRHITVEGRLPPLLVTVRHILRFGTEKSKPEADRMRAYAESRLPRVRSIVMSPAPFHASLEVERLAEFLSRLREHLGADDPIVRAVLAEKSPRELAASAIAETKLLDAAVRTKLLDSPPEQLKQMDDPLLRIVRALDQPGREMHRIVQEEVFGTIERSHEQVARARFAVYGQSIYPDATFSLRLSFGRVSGFTERDGRQIQPFTTAGQFFERGTGREPFEIPESWLKAKPNVPAATPFNFATTNDVIGGNSGSPIINRGAEVVGVIFDGNIHSLGGSFAYEDALNRAIGVDSRTILMSLDKVYGAGRLMRELTTPAK